MKEANEPQKNATTANMIRTLPVTTKHAGSGRRTGGRMAKGRVTRFFPLPTTNDDRRRRRSVSRSAIPSPGCMFFLPSLSARQVGRVKATSTFVVRPDCAGDYGSSWDHHDPVHRSRPRAAIRKVCPTANGVTPWNWCGGRTILSSSPLS
jgi:hypothetical protein